MAESTAETTQQTGSFGDVLNALLVSLPSDASASFFRCLAGLTAEESNMLSMYLLELKEEKKYRVIQHLMEAPVPAKKTFIVSLHEKFERLKQQNTIDPRTRLERTNSRQSSLRNVSTEEMQNVNQMMGKAHIGESEIRLNRLIEDSKNGNGQHHTDKKLELMINKRERPSSNYGLLDREAAPAQKTKEISSEDDDEEDEVEAENSPDGEPSTELNEDDAPTTKRWTKAQDNALRESVRMHGEKNWKAIAERVPGRNHAQCLQRWRKVLKPGLVKGHWSFEEDKILEVLVKQSCNNWGQIAEQIPGRTPKQCRERWRNHLDPSINKGPYAEEEDTVILTNQARLGNKWSQIAQMLPGRTEDSVKIRWKSLKQNPTRAAAANAQSRRMNLQQQHGYDKLQGPNTMHQHGMRHNEPMVSNWNTHEYSHGDYNQMGHMNPSFLYQHQQAGDSMRELMNMKPDMYTAHYPPPMHHAPPPQTLLHHGQNYDDLLMKSLTEELDFDEFSLI